MKRNFILLIFLLAPFAFAVPPVLKWGADAQGGAPYVFPDAKHPDQVVGFEVDLMEAIGTELHVKTEFVQSQWDSLVPALERGSFDIAVNGIEITPDRAEVVVFSIPYYITYEQLCVRRDTDNRATLKDCIGKKVGTLKASLAERILEAEKGVEVVTYDGQINAYEDLALGRLDAVLMDSPIAIYYGQTNPKLKLVGSPIGRMGYGIAVRKGDVDLLRELNGALDHLGRTGQLRKIYERWNLWNAAMAESLGDPTPSRAPPTAYTAFAASVNQTRGWHERASEYISDLPLLAQGALMTLALTVVGMAIAVSMGLGLALVRLYGPTAFRWSAIVFIEVVRGTPLLIQLYLIFFGLPYLGIQLNPFLAAILGLGLNYAAYEAENYRAGLTAIPLGQTEAASALGMTRWQTLRHVLIPQTIRFVIPPMTNDFISLLKDSSLVSVITMVELTLTYNKLASQHFDYLGLGLLTAAVYFTIGLPFVGLSRWAEKRFSAGQPGITLPR